MRSPPFHQQTASLALPTHPPLNLLSVNKPDDMGLGNSFGPLHWLKQMTPPPSLLVLPSRPVTFATQPPAWCVAMYPNGLVRQWHFASFNLHWGPYIHSWMLFTFPFSACLSNLLSLLSLSASHSFCFLSICLLMGNEGEMQEFLPWKYASDCRLCSLHNIDHILYALFWYLNVSNLNKVT